MPFDRGTFTLAMFDLGKELPENMLELFAARKAGTLDSVTAEPQIGWVTGRHLLDTVIDGESAMLGGCCYLMLRQASRKVPASLLNALCKREERAYMKANNLSYVSSKQKKLIREEMTDKYLQQMPPSLSGIPMVLDTNEKLLYVGASSRTQLEMFIDQFFQTVKVEPIQLTPELLLEKKFNTTEASFPSLSFNGEPIGEPAVGRDFLTWLWYTNEKCTPLNVGQYGEFEVMVEGPFVFASEDDARGSGEVSVKKGEATPRSAEAKAALAAGKKLKKAKLSFTRANQIWSGTFDADQFSFGSFKLPEGEEMSNDDEIFAERMLNLSIFKEAFSAYFEKFATDLTGAEADQLKKELIDWAKNRDEL
ncbi:MAG: recombination-associated protein RdgC [Victivallaceae bacterium]|nr:recombination-associated protein RdgC [Victivallaceae bacterium]